MDVKKYVNEIVKNIQCGGAKRKEIKKQLLTEMEDRLQQGAKPEEIIEQMGSAEEIAAGFNENLSEQEKKSFRRNRVLRILLLILAGLLLILYFVYLQIPKVIEIEDSKYFTRQQAEEVMKKTIDLWDAEDYEALREMSDPRMAPLLTKERMDKERAKMAEDWGARKSVGSIYLAETIQRNKHYIVGEVVVTYENVKVVYRLSYDEQMRFAGIYFR